MFDLSKRLCLMLLCFRLMRFFPMLLLWVLSSGFDSQATGAITETKIRVYDRRDGDKKIKRVVRRITNDDQSDLEKVKAIHDWITHRIKYDVKKYLQNDLSVRPVHKIIRRKRGTCAEYAACFVAMCEEADVVAIKVEGIAKNKDFDVHREMALADHAWNAVRIDGQWGLIDVCWDSGYIKYFNRTAFGWVVYACTAGKLSYYRYQPKFKKRPTEDYFLTDAACFIHDHFPSNSVWQLQEIPLSHRAFVHDSAFYYQNRPHKNAPYFFSSSTCDAISNMDTLTYLITQAEQEWQTNTHNPVLLMEKRKEEADRVFIPKGNQQQTETAWAAYHRADSALMIVLNEWELHKQRALAFNDLKSQRHQSSHEFLWKGQTTCARELERLNKGMKTHSKRRKAWSKSWFQRWQKLNTSAVQSNKRLTNTRCNSDSLLLAWTKEAFYLDSLNRLIAEDHQLLVARCEQQREACQLAIPLQLGLMAGHDEILWLRLFGVDDLDRAIVERQRALCSDAHHRESLITELKDLHVRSMHKQMAQQRKIRERQCLKSAKRLRSTLRLLQKNDGPSNRVDSIEAIHVQTMEAIARDRHESLQRESEVLKQAANDYPYLRRLVHKERRKNQREHQMALSWYGVQSKRIQARHRSVKAMFSDEKRSIHRRLTYLGSTEKVKSQNSSSQ
jgi:hypothetical protein